MHENFPFNYVMYSEGAELGFEIRGDKTKKLISLRVKKLILKGQTYKKT